MLAARCSCSRPDRPQARPRIARAPVRKLLNVDSHKDAANKRIAIERDRQCRSNLLPVLHTLNDRLAELPADLDEEGEHPVSEPEAVREGAQEALLLRLGRRHAEAPGEDVRLRHGGHGLGHVLLLHAGARGGRGLHPVPGGGAPPARKQRLAAGRVGVGVAPVRGRLGRRRHAHDGGQLGAHRIRGPLALGVRRNGKAQ